MLALLLAACAPAMADDDAPGRTCPDGIEAVLRDVLAKHDGLAPAARGTLMQLDCTVVPGDKQGAIHAIASFRDDATRSYTDGGEGESYGFILATIDGDDRLRHHIVATAIEDATTLFLGGEFTLDTAFHDIAPGGGVVGLAVSQTAPGASAPENRWGDEFALFVPEGRGFRRVLGLARYRQEAIEGCLNLQCRGARWVNTAATLAPGTRTDDGWRAVEMRLDAEELAVEPAVALSSPTSTALTLFHRDGAYRLDDGATPPGSEHFGLVPW